MHKSWRHLIPHLKRVKVRVGLHLLHIENYANGNKATAIIAHEATAVHLAL